MAVISVEVPDKIAMKFISYEVVSLKDLTMEEKLVNMDWEWWEDVSVNMEAGEFLKMMKKEIISK